MLLTTLSLITTIEATDRVLGAASAATSGSRWTPLVGAARRVYSPGAAPVAGPFPPPPRRCPRAAVVTTINAPTDAIRAVAATPGWCLVVVGDSRTPNGDYEELVRTTESVTYLSLAAQRDLPFEVIAKTPVGHFGRKNIGYLYAIWCGADVIFDFDDDNAPLSLTALDDYGPTVLAGIGMLHASGPTVACNPYPWFGATFSWPRGLPLESINARGAKCKVAAAGNFSHEHRIGVVQSLANHDPDVDAIYRLGPRAALALPFSFSASKPRALLVLAGSAVAPFNAQATWWHTPVFAGLMLPTTVHGRVSDIWRSYVAQHAMRCEGIRLAFAAPAVEQIRNVHDYLADYMAERPLYEQAGALIRAVADVPCAATVDATVAAAYVALYEQGFVEREDVELVHEFLRDLGRAAAPAPAPAAGSAGQRPRSYADVERARAGVATRVRGEVAIVVMTKNDVPLLSRWLIYHGHVFGFENIYIFDGSDSAQVAYLEGTAARFPFHLRHSLVNLNEITGELLQWMVEIKDRYEWIMKVDTDEFVCYATGKGEPDVSSSSLHLPKGSAAEVLLVQWHIGSEPVQSGSPTESKRAEIAQIPYFKQIYSGPRFVNNTFNLGSHATAAAQTQTAPGLTIVHYRRTYEEYVRLATQTIRSHGYIDATDSSAEMIQKLKLFDKRPNCTMHSCHKNWIVLDDLQNRTKMRSAYYASNGKARPVLHEWRDYLREIFRMYPSLLRE